MKTDLQGIGMTSRRTRERLISRLKEKGVKDERVLQVMLNTPRHIFVDEALASRAYEDTALPIGFGQTISQPHTVAVMTEALLENGPMGRVLEIGTGSGYQTVILAQLVGEVFTVERIERLQVKARQRVRQLELNNVRFKFDDGNLGWAEKGPFDGIIVTAAPGDIPKALLEQLAEGGRMLIPSGESGKQQLHCIIRNGSEYDYSVMLDVEFVPLLKGTQ